MKWLIIAIGMFLPPFALAQPAVTPLPVDTAITVGTLANGLKYYIRANGKPEKRAELRLVVNAGSILEDDDQRGLAHFCEHMAFNGTLHYRKNELVNYLESIGMRFGPDVNAYTSFDETVYMLQIPTDTAQILEHAFQILEDWAHLVSYDDDEIDKERGVVIEEWRLGRGASARMRDKQFPVLFRGSRYAERLPIGEKSILESFRHETLRSFYRSWYRPDLMAIVAVGDFDKPVIERLIREHFAGIEPLRSEKARTFAPVPDIKEPLYSVVTDSEATLSSVDVYWKHPTAPQGTEADYRRSVVEGMYNSMLNDRLAELTRKPDPPFLFASSSDGDLVRTKAAYILEAGTNNSGLLRGLRAVLREAYRVRQFGFTATELERQKSDMLRSIEQMYDERDKSESSGFAAEFIRNYLTGEPIPGIRYENELYHRLVPGISLDEINVLGKQWMTDDNRVVLVKAPAKAGVVLPTPAELSAIFDSVAHETLEPYEEHIGDRPLVPSLPPPGSVVSEHAIPELGVTELRLSNGMRVIVKPTSFKNDEVIFSAFAPGGTSLAADSDFVPALTASSIVDQGGLGEFDPITLGKMLAGKIVNVSPYIGELEEGLSGNANPRDLETLFQLIYLTIASPRVDTSAFLAYRSRIQAYLQNRSDRPESALEDTLEVTMSQYHPRRQPFSEAMIGKFDLAKSFAFYRKRFAEPGSFTFVFTGNIPVDTVRQYAAKYLAALPAGNGSQQWRDIGVHPPRGIVQKTVAKGMEAKSQVRIVFSGPFEWSQENRHMLNTLCDVLNIRLREELREEKGGTYGVSVGGVADRDPRPEYRLSVSFGCAPDRMDELVKTAFEELDSVRRYGVSEGVVAKVRETQKREHETRLRENQFWLSNLEFYYDHGDDPRKILRYEKLVEELSPANIQDAAKRFLDLKNYVKVTLTPR